MFPHCANPDCTASFSNFREGMFFRFRRSSLAGESPSNSHSVEHCWLCRDCSEEYTLDYRDNRSILISLVPALTLPPQPMEAPPPSRRARVKRRPHSTRRAPARQPHTNPLLILALTPSSIDNS